ncbi:unnamed protein product [Cyprideis torosa]|uniref:Uncharacterized protein n=1 Tax=Cyprideis torosa TaxID=163714 RepID=A0A7R8WEJ4_9CRUS|nr:unnamed protein product [Cyprideis torosa]CAG0894423.1 unnamed protein product [Cyprideis torosa]
MSGSFSMSRRIGMILLLLAICQELCYSEILRFDPNLDGGSIVHIIRKRSPDEPSSPPSFPSDNSTASDPSTDVLPPRHIDDVKYESSDSLSPTESPKPVVSSSSSIPSANAPVSQSSPGTSTTTTSAIPPDEQTFPPLLPNSGSGDDDLDDDEILELDAIKTAIMDILKGLGNDSDPFSEAKPDPELRDPEEDKEHDQWKSLMEKLKNQGYIRENEIINATAVWDEKDRTNVSIKNSPSPGPKRSFF